MKKSLMIVSALFISCAAMAQSGMNPGVTESTDQAKISAIEQHAQQLTNKSGMPLIGDQGMDHKHGMKHHKMHGHKKMAMKDGGDMKDSGAMKDGSAMKDGAAMKDSGAAMDSGATKNGAPMKDNAQMKKGMPMTNKAAGDATMNKDKKN